MRVPVIASMRESHPDRWTYGGILRTEPWAGHGRLLVRWDGTYVYVRQGESITLLRTGSEKPTFVDVVRA